MKLFRCTGKYSTTETHLSHSTAYPSYIVDRILSLGAIYTAPLYLGFGTKRHELRHPSNPNVPISCIMHDDPGPIHALYTCVS